MYISIRGRLVYSPGPSFDTKEQKKVHYLMHQKINKQTIAFKSIQVKTHLPSGPVIIIRREPLHLHRETL
jgi:hypothetical protein